ncbi:exodeoxyribonuclease VII large subunit [Sphingomonas panni]|uniref:exodeoxyribonuclease VII large subunit n=1 Tax=Sphingomonas panni TaxID=237612 RepID=UPI001F5B7B9F|nr:exodeoxyribonuclease VII large subunit [Sphingomonas panni]
MPEAAPPTTDATVRNATVGLKAYLDDIGAVVSRMPPVWVRCELHALRVGGRFTRMEFIELDSEGRQVAKVQGGCWPATWRWIEHEFHGAGLALEAGSQVLVKLQARLNPTFGFQVVVEDVDLTFALGDLNARMQAIRTRLTEAGIWDRNRSLPRPDDFVRVAVIAPAGAAGLGDFRSTADRLDAAGLVEFVYHEVPFQTREAPARIVEALRLVYRSSADEGTRPSAVAIIRGGGASADLAWLVDDKLVEAVCRMNVPVITGIGHEQDRNLLDEVACIACDTPSKVVELVRSVVVRAASEAGRAIETIRSDALRTVERREADVGVLNAAAGRDATEGVRLAEAAARRTAGEIEPRSRTMLDASRSTVAAALLAVERNAWQVVRTAESTVRTTATALEPDARARLDEVRDAIVASADETRAGPRRSTELAAQGVRNVRRSVASAVEGCVRSFDVGIGRATSEIRARSESVPQAASDAVEELLRRLGNDVGTSVRLLDQDVTACRRRMVEDAGRALDECASAIGGIRVRADALHPGNVLAAGYAILRDENGGPLTSASVVGGRRIVMAEMRDGTTRLRSDEDHEGDRIE